MQEGKQGFTGVWVPKELLNSTELTASEKILYANIASFSKCCFETNERLAEKCGISERSISRSLQRLQECGYIVVEYVKNDSSRRRIYAILDNPKKIQYLVKKGLFPQENINNNREEIQSFPQGSQNGEEGRQNGEHGSQNGDPQNRGEGRQNGDQRIKNKKKNKGTPEQEPNFDNSADRAAFDRRAPAFPTRKALLANEYT